MWKRILSIAGKEFIHIRRDKRTLAIIIVIPALWLVIFGYAASFDLKNVPLAVVDRSRSEKSRQLVEALVGMKGHDFVLADEKPATEKALRAAIAEGKVQIGLVIPSSFGKIDLFGGGLPGIRILVDGSEPIVAQSNLRKVSIEVQRYAAREIVGGALPINPDAFLNLVKIETLYNPRLRSANFMIPGLAGMIVLFIASFLTAMGIVREREHGTLEQLVVSPLRPMEMMLGKMLPYIVLSFFDFLLIVGLGVWIFDVPFAGSLALLLVGAALFLLCVLGIGLFISTVAQNQQQAMQIALITVFPSFILSGFIFPLTAIPWAIRWVAYAFPFTYFLPVLRGIILKGLGLAELWPKLAVLGAYGVAILILASLRYKRQMAKG